MKTIKTVVSGILISATIMTSAFATYSTGGGTIKGTDVNLRKSSSTSSSVLGSLNTGDNVIVYGQDGSWYHVASNGNDGYVYSDFVNFQEECSGNFGSGYINGNYVRMRSEPSTSSSIVGNYNYGTNVSITGVNGAWYKVDCNGTSGYIRSDLVNVTSSSTSSNTTAETSQSSTTTTTTTTSTETAYVTGDYVNMRSGGGTGYSVVRVLAKGTGVTVLDKSGSWWKISYSGKEGYMLSDYLSTSAPASSSEATSSQVGTVTGSWVNMRSGPDTSYSIVKQLSRNTSVSVLEKSGNWYKVQHGGSTGYMCADYISVEAGSGSNEISVDKTEAQTGLVTEATRLKSGPSSNYSTITSVGAGSGVTVTGTSGDYYEVMYSGLTGFIEKSSISLDTNTVTASTGSVGEQVVNKAKSYLGVSYVYGGSSPSGFDCSGLVYYVFRSLGMTGIKRCAIPQYTQTAGIPIDKSELEPGDLVFFSGSWSTDFEIEHVGIYIGNNQFIHASSGRGCVTINDLSQDYYTTYYWGAKRVIGYI